MDPILLPIHCPMCGRPLTVAYSKPAEGGDLKPYSWRCPHEGCVWEGTSLLHGQVVGIYAGHLPRPESK